MALIRLILNGFSHLNSKIYILFAKESDGIIKFPYRDLVLRISVNKCCPQKWDQDIFVDCPFFNREHQENWHVEPFPYTSWYNDHLSRILHWLSVKFTSLGSDRSYESSKLLICLSRLFQN